MCGSLPNRLCEEGVEVTRCPGGETAPNLVRTARIVQARRYTCNDGRPVGCPKLFSGKTGRRGPFSRSHQDRHRGRGRESIERRNRLIKINIRYLNLNLPNCQCQKAERERICRTYSTSRRRFGYHLPFAVPSYACVVLCFVPTPPHSLNSGSVVWIAWVDQFQSTGQFRSGQIRSPALSCDRLYVRSSTPYHARSDAVPYHTVVIHRTRWWTFLYALHIVSHAPPSVNDGLSFPLATFDSRGLDSQPRVNPLILSEEKDWPRMEMAAQGFTINAPLKKNSLTSANATHIITLCICRCRSTIVSP